jgi:hypothetical protein
MSGRMNLIVAGTGIYQNWPELKLVQANHTQFTEYVRQYWPDPRITEDAALEPMSAPELRRGLADWLMACQADDDLILLWSGHGHVVNGMHRLITFESPYPGPNAIWSENSLTTGELADYLIHCPARRIIVLLNTCWSGDGGQQLAETIGHAMADSPDAAQTRSMVIISSARREPSLDGAFLTNALKILRASVPVAGVPPEHRWSATDRWLSPEALFAAVNVLLKNHDHQAQMHVPYGMVGGFFRRMQFLATAPELPARVVTRLFSDFSGHLSGRDQVWDLDQVRDAINDFSGSEPSGELGFRLRKLAVALSMLAFLEGWLGSGSGLANRMSPAWASVLSPIHRTAKPPDRFGYIEQVVLHGGAREIIEFAARVIQHAEHDPCDSRLYRWAHEELGVDAQVVDDALARLVSKREASRVIINFGMTIPDNAEEDALPQSVIAWIWSRDGQPITSPEYPFDPPYDVADMVATLVDWARTEVGDVEHVDVALPVSLFGSPSRPESARLRLKGALTRPVVMSSGLVVRWADRISRPGLRSDGANQARAIDGAPDPLCWVDRSACAKADKLLDHLTGLQQAVGFTFEPKNLALFYAAAYSSPYLLWTDGDGHDIGSIQYEVKLRWPHLPSHLSAAYQSAAPTVIRAVRVIWDDSDWLENIVPKLLNPSRRLHIRQ